MTEFPVYLDERRHGIVLVRPLCRALGLASIGVGGIALGWPASLAGTVLLAVSAAGVLAAVWRWDRTHVIVTSESLVVLHGTLRRSAAEVPLASVRALEIDQSVLGRLLGYGTVVAGDLAIDCVPQPRELIGLVRRLAG